MYNFKTVQIIYAEIKALELKHNPSLDNATYCQMQEQFNGCGADWFPWVIRYILSFVLKLRATVAVHDWAYYKSDGDDKTRRKVDNEFFTNGLKEIRYHWSWWNLYRYFMLIKLSIAYISLKTFSSSSWQNAHEKYNNN